MYSRTWTVSVATVGRTTSSGIGQKPIGWLVWLQMRMHQLNCNIVRCVWWHHGKILQWCHADTLAFAKDAL